MNDFPSNDDLSDFFSSEIINRYERIRRCKMYRQKNNQGRFVNFIYLREFLLGLPLLKRLVIRLHYQQLGSSAFDDIPLITLAKFDPLERENVLFSIKKIVHDSSGSIVIYQLSAEQDEANNLAQVLPFQRDLLEFSSLIEILYTTFDKNKNFKIFEGIRYNQPNSNHFLIPLTDYSYTEPSIINKYSKPRFFDLWLDLCEQRWDLFFPDVRNREIALDCWDNGRYFVRRTWISGKRAMIFDQSDVSLVKQVKAISLIPNIHLVHPNNSGMLEPVEAMIDLDPAPGIKEEDIFYLGNSFTNYLSALGIKFLRRLSSGRHGGIHYLIPLYIQNPFPLISATPPFHAYFSRNRKDLLVNSVRHTMEGLVLHFLLFWLREDKYLKRITLDPDKRKIRFDTSRNTRFGGRRSIFSSHVSTSKIVIPIPEHEITFSQYEQFCKFSDVIEAKKIINDFYEPNYQSLNNKISNTQKLFLIAEEIGEFWEEYLTQRQNRFWNITIQEKKAKIDQ